MMEIKSMCTIELLALWGIFISASAESILIICVKGLSTYYVSQFRGFADPPSPPRQQSSAIALPPSSAMVSICLTPPPPLVSLRQHLADPPSTIVFKEKTLFDMKL